MRRLRSWLRMGARALGRWGIALCRVLGLAVALFAVTAGVSLHFVEARIGRALDSVLGTHASWPSEGRRASERLVVVNGLEIKVLSSTVALPLDDTLDALARRCRSMTGFDATELELANDSTSIGGNLEEVFDGVIRWKGGDHGVVACLDTGGPLSLSELEERATAFRDSRDLSDLGQLRFAQARSQYGATSGRPVHRTAVLWIWTEGSVRLDALFPSQGDAPGIDPQGFELLRPPGVRRVFSAAELEHPYAVAIYQAPELTAAQVREYVSREAIRAGLVTRRWRNGLSVRAGTGEMLVDIAANGRGGVVLRVSQLASPEPGSVSGDRAGRSSPGE